MSPMKGCTGCAVPGCANEPHDYANLCDLHRQPGMALEAPDGSTMVITCWLACHGTETGIVLLNDYALGDLHGGAEGFPRPASGPGFHRHPPANDSGGRGCSQAEGAGQLVRALAARVPVGEGDEPGCVI